MKKSRLYDLIGKFASEASHSEDDLNIEFSDIARELIFGGLFKVTYKDADGEKRLRCIRIVDAEGYYFDDRNADGVRDWIMYHRDVWKRGSIDPVSPAYLPVGTFYLHNSGVDLTFESKKHGYRASMLLRSYQMKGVDNEFAVLEFNDLVWSEAVQSHPTYLYDDMLSVISPFDDETSIEWLQYDDKPENAPGTAYRQNVARFATPFHGNGEPQKMSRSLYPEMFMDKKNVITQDGKSLQDTKKWRFFDTDIEKSLKLRGNG